MEDDEGLMLWSSGFFTTMLCGGIIWINVVQSLKKSKRPFVFDHVERTTPSIPVEVREDNGTAMFVIIIDVLK